MSKRLAALLLLARTAAAAPVVVGDGDPRWKLDLAEDWRAETPPQAAGGTVLAAWARAGGWRLVLARQRGNTDGAYDGSKAFFDGLEAGVKRDTEGYKRLSVRQRALGPKGKIPAYDLWYRTRGGVRGARFILMKGYAVMATIDLPRARRVDATARKVLESLAPAF